MRKLEIVIKGKALSGKTTLANKLEKFLEENGYEVRQRIDSLWNDNYGSIVDIIKFRWHDRKDPLCAICWNYDNAFCLNDGEKPCIHFNYYRHEVISTCISFSKELCLAINPTKACGDISSKKCPKNMKAKQEKKERES